MHARTNMYPIIRLRVPRFVLVAIVMLPGVFAVPAAAGPADSGWHIRPEFHLARTTNYLEYGGGAMHYDTTAATLELTLLSGARAYRGGPFLDYRVSSDGRVEDQFNLGVYFRYDLPRWDATTWLFANRSPGNAPTWWYAARLRYRLVADHKLGIEAMASLDDPAAAMLMGGYYGSLSQAWSVKLLAGSTTSGDVDLAARLELAWHMH